MLCPEDLADVERLAGTDARVCMAKQMDYQEEWTCKWTISFTN